MSEPSLDGPGRDALRAIREDQERRNEAKKNLTSALTNYLEQLPRDPPGLPNSILSLAEIWGAYAVSLYDSAAERYFAGSPDEPLALFGDSGELQGGVTFAEVKEALQTLRVPPPRHWPVLNFSREDDPPEMRSTMKELAHGVAALPYSFSWLLGDEWFMREIRSRVANRSAHWRKKYEGSLPPPPPSVPPVGTNKGGRPRKDHTRDLYLKWVGMGKPKVTGTICDTFAKEFFRAEFVKAKPGSKTQKRIRDRVRTALRRAEKWVATKPVS